MKTLSFYQPFPWLIANGFLDSDERTWWSGYKGPLAIHASKKNYDQIYLHVRDDLGLPIPPMNELEHGGIVAVTNMIGCKKEDGRYFFLFANTRKVDFIPCRGQPGLFDLDIIIPEL